MRYLPIGYLLFVVASAFFAPQLAPHQPHEIVAIPYSPPNDDYLLGTDSLGRDVLSRMLYGGRRTLLVSGLATLLVVMPGTCLGVLAGISQNWLDKIIQVIVNTMLAIPSLMLALVIITLGGRGIIQLVLATGLSLIPLYIQVSRAATRQMIHQDYIEGAFAVGASWWGVFTRHIFPNVLPVLLNYASVIFSYCLISSAALSFLGLGGEPGIPDWGVMLAEGRSAFRSAPWLGIIPGLAIFLTVFSVNFLLAQSSE
ncbi:MAG: ABC transporter permease subunit [Phototrophicales bacterium]